MGCDGTLHPGHRRQQPTPIRSVNQHQLTVPRCRRITFGRRAFSVVGPTVWNSLPIYFRDLSVGFYRAMHFSAKRGIAIACRLSVCLSVCL